MKETGEEVTGRRPPIQNPKFNNPLKRKNFFPVNVTQPLVLGKLATGALKTPTTAAKPRTASEVCLKETSSRDESALY